MPEENIISTDVKSALDCLENYVLENHLSRTQDYNTILNFLEKGESLSLEDIERLLAICVHDLREDMRYIATIMNIISAILARVQKGEYEPRPDLLPSALAVIHVIKTTALLSKVETLKVLCYKTLLSYPDDTLIAATEHHEEIMEIFNLYCHMRIPVKIRLQACGILQKLLKILPKEKKRIFVAKGISVWFSKLIPSIMSHLSVVYTDYDVLIEILELLTEELVACDYADNQQWHQVLECICASHKYPAIMKSLLQRGSNIWHRVWIVFIRLLKNQVTQSVGAVETPINSMLPVVEAAFKVDVDNRCKAFECWNVLIDSFSAETNESNINKRIKLLIIPLKSNNAKAEETALAKFRCWWHLIQKFQNKIDKFIDTVLVSFLHFCFGKHNIIDKSILIPGQISVAMKKQCIQAIVDMVGHVNCQGCTDLPKLKGKLISTKNLVDNWNHWIFSLTSTIMMSANPDNGSTKQQITCLWKSFVLTIGELPENNIRSDLFAEMLSILEHLVKECKSNSKFADIVLNALILPLFDGDAKIKELLKSRSEEDFPLCKIIMVILDPSLHLAYQSYNTRELVTKLTPITSMMLDPLYSTPTFSIGFLIKKLTATDISLIVWTALVESMCQARYEFFCVQILCDVLMWPLQLIHKFTDIKTSAMTWYTMYDSFRPKLKRCDAIDKGISKFLFTVTEVNPPIVYFKLCVTLCVIKHKLTEGSCTACEQELELLHFLVSRIDNYQNYEQLFPILIDRVLAALGIVVTNVNETAARYLLFCVKKMLKVMTQACKQLSDVSHIITLIESLLKSLNVLFQVESYHRFIPFVIEDLNDCSSFLSQQSLTIGTILSVMKTVTSKIVDTDITFKKIKTLSDDIKNETIAIDQNQSSDKNKFTTPKTKEVPKKTKKKEASIVNTVVENGEEYVVVKSNWKFNPRKLTENQKEKLQRKREDIPALYQDLSQSQDEFKLVSWKTDSQDTSNSSKSESKSSKTGSNETATEILSNLPSSNVVPKILENFFGENVKSPTNAKDLLPADKNVNKIEAVTPKNTKSPRMALKDRVFRNVRNLIEKSGVQNENKNASEDLNKTESILKTPTQSKSDTANIVNSAPPLLSADRPSRVKRKPKKFEELQLQSAKKIRQSLQDLKSKDQSKQSNPDTTSSNTDTDKQVIKEGSPSRVVPDEEMIISGDLQVPENQNISIDNEVVQSTENLPKDVNEINNKTDVAIESPAVEINSNIKHIINIDLDSSEDTNMNNEISNENKNESSIECKNESANNKKSETCNDGKDKNTNKDSEKSHDIQDESSNDNDDKSSNEEMNEISHDKKEETNDKNDISSEKQTSLSTKDVKELSTPQQVSTNKGTEEQKSTTKKSSVRKSRIEKELAIDMVEGHPFLKMQSQKRLTRKALESVGTGRRKSLVEKLNKSKSEAHSTVKTDKKTKEKNKESDSSNSSFTVDDSQEKDSDIKDHTTFTEDLPYSDDVIESSQDSTITTISVKSTKKSMKKVPVVTIEKLKLIQDKVDDIKGSQSILVSVTADISESTKANQDSKDDIELPLNKTAAEEKSEADLTENMDTEPIDEKELSEVIVINDDIPAPLTISSDDTEVGPETQEIAEADTQPTDPDVFMEVDVVHNNTNTSLTVVTTITNEISNNEDKEESLTKEKSASQIPVNPSENTTLTLSESACVELEKESGASSPSSFRDEAKRKQDFLNNTLEISPIKNMSPERTKKSPSPDTSSDYVVITLSSPVHSNGEPFEKCGSPEVFTEDKVSPDKRDQSPPRVEVTVTNTSPSSSLSLKKNRPQVRSGGRAAQMLGLCCVPDKVQAIINQEKIETEEIIKTSTSSTPARRNLRILYNSVSENIEPATENEDSENFLKFRRSLPAVDSSPAGPILKRKLVDIADDATISPACKRKRVSFHDPPVSTMVSVQKYIEPGVLRSPQNSAHKRLERQQRQNTPLKSSKRLDHAFKLDTVLNKAIESFTETGVISTPDDTQPFSLDETPVVEIVRASELNDTEPICPELIDCKDPIDNIASELSSYAMKSLLVKELVGKVETVGDLAKMTELEVNRLCIKAPKVKVAKKVLSDYASKRVEKPSCDVVIVDEAIFDEPMPDPELKSVECVDIEVQTVTNASVEMEVQTVAAPTTVTFVQTETTPTAHTVVQTDETGSKSTADIVKLCLAERPDFVEHVGEHLEKSSIQQITETLPFTAITDVLMKKVTPSDAKTLLNRVLEEQWNNTPDENRSSKELSFMREYMCNRFDPKDLILFCSELLKSVYDKPKFP